MKRLGIYLTYDKQNIVDAYIGYMLKELKTCLDYLVVVCNETEIVRGREILEQYADQIFLRENVGFDAGGFKDALCTYLGWEKVFSYDELVLVNDSFFGPFRPMKDIFSKMQNEKVDFWGLIKHGGVTDFKEYHLAEHIQSFFFCVRGRMLHSELFRSYWERMPYYKTLDEVVKQHETKFTKYFFSNGFTYTTLADTECNDSSNLKNNYVQYAMLPYELIKKRNFPFLKKQQIPYNSLYIQTQENQHLAMEYIDKHTDYDINLIWENIIRTLNVSDLQKKLNLQYIVSEEFTYQTSKSKIMIAVFIKYSASFDYVLDYLEDLKDFCAITIFSYDKNLLDKYQAYGFNCRLISSLEELPNIFEFLGCYEYVCVIHDTDVTSDIDPSCMGKSYLYNKWENLLKNKNHVNGIIHYFDTEKKLGFLAPPKPIFASFFENIGSGWNESWDKIKSLTEKMGLECQISESKPPFTIPSDFWIKGEILIKLSKRLDIHIDYLPFLWIYIVQDAGYYSGIIESTSYAAMNQVNLQYYLEQIASQIRETHCTFKTFYQMQKCISSGTIILFCKKYKNIYVYGTGLVAERCKDALRNVKAFVVSDGQPKAAQYNGKRVIYLSEVVPSSDTGIILCLNRKHQEQVIPKLKEKGLLNYLCVF